MPDDLETILPQLKAGLLELYGERLKHVILYGSQARGEADGDSDIDVMVVLEGAVNPAKEIHQTIDLVWRLSFEHDTLIACTFISESDYAEAGSPLIINVRKEGIPI